jgi:hypothetical protein
LINAFLKAGILTEDRLLQHGPLQLPCVLVARPRVAIWCQVAEADELLFGLGNFFGAVPYDYALCAAYDSARCLLPGIPQIHR